MVDDNKNQINNSDLEVLENIDNDNLDLQLQVKAVLNKNKFQEQVKTKLQDELTKVLKADQILAESGQLTEKDLDAVSEMLREVEKQSVASRAVAESGKDQPQTGLDSGLPATEAGEAVNKNQAGEGSQQVGPEEAQTAQPENGEEIEPSTAETGNDRAVSSADANEPLESAPATADGGESSELNKTDNNDQATQPEEAGNNRQPSVDTTNTPQENREINANESAPKASTAPATTESGKEGGSGNSVADFAAERFADKKLSEEVKKVENLKMEVERIKKLVRTFKKIKDLWSAIKAGQLFTGESGVTLVTYWLSLNLQLIVGGFEIIPGQPIFSGVGKYLGFFSKKLSGFSMPLNAVELFLLLIVYVDLFLNAVVYLIIYYILTLGTWDLFKLWVSYKFS
jgi:hypothetical protein